MNGKPDAGTGRRTTMAAAFEPKILGFVCNW
jgi:hypothetical protein